MSISGLAMISRASFTTRAALPTTASARAVSRSATMVISMRRPARRWISSWLRRSTLKTPLPTVPMPSRPTWIGFTISFLGCARSSRALGRSRGFSGAVPFAVVVQEARDAADGLAQVVLVRQEHDAEVVRLRPVEAGALHQHHPRFLQQ